MCTVFICLYSAQAAFIYLVSVCDLAKQMESISHKNRVTEMKANSQITLLQRDQLSQVTLPNSTVCSNPSTPSAENLRLNAVSAFTTSTTATLENGEESYLQIAQPKRSFDNDSQSIVSTGISFILTILLI